jgi:uncharacterized repeat protein (TIGR01451 family)
LASVGTPAAIAASSGSAASGNLTTDGQSNLTLDFSYVKPVVSVGDFVWHDLNGNGLQDPGEPGISGVTVTLTGLGGGAVTDINGKVVGPQVTDSSGKYVFSNLPVPPVGQTYTVHVDDSQAALAGDVPTLANAGTNTAIDSSTGSAAATGLLMDGASDLSLDFGFATAPSAPPPPPTAGPSLAITQTTSPPPAVPGNDVTYTLKVTNSGPVTATDVLVTDVLPPDVTVVSVPHGCKVAAGKVTCTIASIPSGKSVVLKIVAAVSGKASGKLVNTAKISTKQVDATVTKPTSSTALPVARPHTLRLAETVTKATLEPGDVLVCDQLPTRLAGLATDPKAHLRDGRPCWTISKLPAHGHVSFTLSAKALGGSGAHRLVNPATASAVGVATAHAHRSVRILAAPLPPGGVTG